MVALPFSKNGLAPNVDKVSPKSGQACILVQRIIHTNAPPHRPTASPKPYIVYITRFTTPHALYTPSTFEFIPSAMSAQSYPTPTSPTFGFFPVGTTSPNAFSQFGYSPRDSHSMYATFVGTSSSNATLPQQRAGQQPHNQGSLKRLVSRSRK